MKISPFNFLTAKNHKSFDLLKIYKAWFHLYIKSFFLLIELKFVSTSCFKYVKEVQIVDKSIDNTPRYRSVRTQYRIQHFLHNLVEVNRKAIAVKLMKLK